MDKDASIGPLSRLAASNARVVCRPAYLQTHVSQSLNMTKLGNTALRKEEEEDSSMGFQYRLEGWEDGEWVQSEWRAAPDRWQTQAADRVLVQLPSPPGSSTTNAEPLLVHQQPRALTDPRVGVGACVWDGALVMAAYLASRPPGTFAGKRCVELGAGAGLCGLVLARLGATVALTDRPALLPLLRRNIAANWLGGVARKTGGDASHAHPPSGRARAQALDWSAPDALSTAAELAAAAPEGGLDYVVATDCCYPNPSGDAPVPQDFVRVAAALCAGGRAQVLTTFEARSDAVRGEMSAAAASLFARVEALPRAGLPEGLRVEHVELYRWQL